MIRFPSVPRPLAAVCAVVSAIISTAAAQFEITYPSTGANRSVNAVAADGRHMVATLAGSGAAPYNLTVFRQPSDQLSAPWSEVASFGTDSLAPYKYHLKSGKSTTWIAWQGQPASGGSRKIQARRVFPTVGPIETVAGSEDQAAGFDLAVDDLDRPCIVSFKTSTPASPDLIPFIRIHRRDAAGTWQYALAASYEEEMIAKPEDVAIATQGDKIHVFDVAWANVTFSGLTLRNSTLYHTEINAPGPLSAATFKYYEAARETSGTSEGLLPAILHVSAAVAPDGMPAVSYSHTGKKEVKYGYMSGTSWTLETLPQPSGAITAQYLDETHLGIDPSGRPCIVWRSSPAGDLARSVRLPGIWSTKLVSTVKLGLPSFCLDHLGNAHYSGIDLSVPGRVVAVRPKDLTDEDGNGFTALLEDAFLMTGGGRENAPEQGIVTIAGKHYPSLGYYRSPESESPPANPLTEGGFRFTVETSPDLVTWSAAAADVVHHETDTGNPEHTFSVWRSAVPLEENSRQFFRMRVSRVE